MKLKTIISKLQEEYTLPISIGDTILMGKFKNKSVVVKSIEMSEKGDLLINGKSAGRFRIKPQNKDLPPDDKGLSECIVFAKMFGDQMVLGKNRDRNYSPKLEVIRELTTNGVEILYARDTETDWCEGINEFGISLVNSALFVKRDEKEFDKSKKKKAMSKDGARIREVLSKKTLAEAVKTAVNFQDGIKGHTLIGDGKKIVSIENTSKIKPIIKTKNLKKEPLVRTNHGLEDPKAGYQRGQDKLSSELRLTNCLSLLHKHKDYTKVFPAVYNHRQDKGPKFDLVRAQNKLWTSSQIILNLNKREMILYLIPGAVEYNGVKNKLPDGKTPSIKFSVRRFDESPDGKHDYYITTDKVKDE